MGQLIFNENDTEPSVPSSGQLTIFAKTDNNLYSKDSDGVVNKITASEAITSLTGEVTGTGPGAASTTISSNAVTNSKLAQAPANTVKGNNTSSTADVSDISLGNFTDSTSGVDGISVSGGTNSIIGSGTSISQQASDSTHNGYLTSTDWSTFNNKEPALSAGTSTQYYRGDKTWQTLNTGAVTESTSLYFTNGRAQEAAVEDLINASHTVVAPSGHAVSTALGLKADKTTQINAGTGLTGGGAINTDRTISMPNVGTAGTYGSATDVPVIITDDQGRVSSVTSTPIPITTPMIQGLYYVAKSKSIGIYVSLRTWMNWDSNFLKIYRVYAGVRTEIPLSQCTPKNTLDYTCTRYVNGDEDTSAPYLVNAIVFNSGVVEGDTIEIDYYEPQNLTYRMNLYPAGWDFNTNAPYPGVAIYSWMDPTRDPVSEIYSNAVFVKQSNDSDTATLAQVNTFESRDNQPSYLPTLYSITGLVAQKEVRYLLPNALIDSYSPLDYDFGGNNIRIEMFRFPKHQIKTWNNTRLVAFGCFNYMGYFTYNTMKVTPGIYIGNNCKYARIGFRLRHMGTNAVSNWLPIFLEIKRGFRPNKTVVIADKRQSILARWRFR
jgi:hypothetical protein